MQETWVRGEVGREGEDKGFLRDDDLRTRKAEVRNGDASKSNENEEM